MAGVTTAARAGWGIIASSYAMNPKAGTETISSTNGVSGNFTISNLAAAGSGWKDLELYVHWNQQSTWSGDGYFVFRDNAGNTSPTKGCYNYWGWSVGSSYGTNTSSQYVYPVSYSNMWSSMRLYCANAFSNQNTKAWWWEHGHSNGNNTSYACVQAGAGVFETSSPVEQMSFTTPWANGSGTYQGWVIVGRNPTT
tara:strand:+ start:752 stop:1339 length:588 start_codon:yes stop_codon:yes gene_type:complete